MSSPSLSDLGKREPATAGADERGTQQRRACANATWNSIHNGVIAVFQRKGLPDQELFSLNEGVRQLLKTELGSFFTEYLQNQLLTKGMVILRDKIRFYEGQKLLDSLAETWDFFFSDVLPTLQAIFYPVQGKEPSVRQLALLHFRNAITLSVKLEDALARTHARVPPAIVQMLLVLQVRGPTRRPLGMRPGLPDAEPEGVHESRGVTKDYLRLETLIQKVVSPYLGTYGLYSSEGPFTHSCILEKHFLRRSRSGDVLAKNPVVRSKSYNTPLLNPVAEHEAEGAAAGGPGIRRHSVSEMTSCPEPQGFSDTPGQASPGALRSSVGPQSGPCPSRLYPPAQPPEPGPGMAHPSPPSSSPENLVDQILESVDSDSEGIFIDFGRGRGPGASEFEGAGGRRSIV
ncbi:proline-rich protein 5 isoform X2 [Mustela nigripes]|nr:proline-rich protein 5 isoform X2 [Mustela lutreola]XP_059043223.1 proline-rich protein 5 isoform X2 [Mustela lutreola]XP_059257803.1 proline-rich protein 5 isoform X2 [Mustela nigripes]XP_059257804.1 proline-rich protein 5 isoform X2 [Mustela nigripes]